MLLPGSRQRVHVIAYFGKICKSKLFKHSLLRLPPFLSFSFFNVYLFLRERERETETETETETQTGHKQGRGREGGRPRIRSRLQALSCQHRAGGRAQIHEQWDHDLSWSQTFNHLSHSGAPPPTISFHVGFPSSIIVLLLVGIRVTVVYQLFIAM